MLEGDYVEAEPSKPPPPSPVRVSRRSQLIAALQQRAKPIVIEDQELARPFARLLRARELRLWALGVFVADTMSYSIIRSYGTDIEAQWYVGKYVLPGNVQRVILKPKQGMKTKLNGTEPCDAARRASADGSRDLCFWVPFKDGCGATTAAILL
jgi:hypothetical protein